MFNNTHNSSHKGHTLTEMLVVLSILLVFISLSMPILAAAKQAAMERTCQMKLKTIGTAAAHYAGSNRMFYPSRRNAVARKLPGQAPRTSRRGRSANSPTWTPMSLHSGNTVTHQALDWRPTFDGYIQLNEDLNDPNVESIDLEEDFATAQNHTYLSSAYTLWFGWQYEGFGGMTKLNQKFAWAEPEGRRAARNPHRFDVLAGDTDAIDLSRGVATSSHADTDNAMGLVRSEDANDTQDPRFIYSFWNTAASQYPTRGLIDSNYVRTDLSVTRLEGVAAATDPRDTDPRVVAVPLTNNPAKSDFPVRWIQLPR